MTRLIKQHYKTESFRYRHSTKRNKTLNLCMNYSNKKVTLRDIIKILVPLYWSLPLTIRYQSYLCKRLWENIHRMFCRKRINERLVWYGHYKSEEAAEPSWRVYTKIWQRKSKWNVFLVRLYKKRKLIFRFS